MPRRHSGHTQNTASVPWTGTSRRSSGPSTPWWRNRLPSTTWAGGRTPGKTSSKRCGRRPSRNRREMASRSGNLDPLVRWSLFTSVIRLFFVLILLPLVSLNQYAVREGIGVFWNRLKEPDALKALRLTVAVALATTAVNGLIGTAMAFILTRYRFPGRRTFNALVDIPLAIPTVVTGFALLLLYGPFGPFGKYLDEH